jgi:hypothetical protein
MGKRCKGDSFQNREKDFRGKERPLNNVPFGPLCVLDSNFNPLNIPNIPGVEIFVFLDVDQNRTFFKGLKGGDPHRNPGRPR